MVSRKLSFILIGLVLITLCGCGSVENAVEDNESAPLAQGNETTETVTEQSIDYEAETNGSNDNSESDSEIDQVRTKAIKDYMYENFGTPGYEASWYSSIKDIRVSGETVYIETSIYPDEEGKQTAKLICNTVAYSDHLTADDYVIVKSQNGLPFSSCYRLN